ncbi:MAG: helix-turn-helix domain-containing protein, partial [Actinomycetota bacterium]|nr:helix-turn-helix domain-containing protein [Actinomycetota bacterium]
RELRAAGRSRREIQVELGIGDDLAKALLRGVPLPDSVRRPRAKDALRAEALDMRRQGATYDQLASELSVSKSTCSLWLRDLPHPELDPERAARAQQRRVEAMRARVRRDRDARDEAGRQVTAAAAASLGRCVRGTSSWPWLCPTGARAPKPSRGTARRSCSGRTATRCSGACSPKGWR